MEMNGLRFVIRRGQLLMLGALMACVGCQSTRLVPPTGHMAGTPNARNGVTGIQLRSGLTVNVQVLVTGKKEIDEKSRRISESGLITLPLVGDVLVDGMTILEAQIALKGLYSKFFVAPQVLVECLMEPGEAAISPWGYVTVLGRVKKPGQVNMPPTRELTVSRAIQLAGGLDTSARSTAIRVTRTSENGTEQFMVDLDQVGARGTVKDDVRLLPGDVVFVPEAVL
jgi:polysaccharide export outer membrane protein